MPLPKYHQIYLVLREQLHEGRFAEGLPGELALMAQFNVARVTVRRALEQLASEGLIARNPGRRTRALPPPGAGEGPAGKSMERANLRGLLENLVTMGLHTSVKVIEVATITASTQVAEALQLQLGDPVQKAVRVRSTKEGPLSHITTYVPDSIARRFGRRELSKKPILVLLEESGVKVGRAHQTISARLADNVLAQHLDVSVGSALLAVRRLIYDEDERPVQWLHGLYRPDRYTYEMQLSRVGSIDAKVWVSKDVSAQFN
ncbi:MULTISPECIES: GntR family transcriptional regulator [Variovorax]|uniref:GntR family transcriptional regulator n=1 Tax=Variovorax TaxID=34072 RepID=UPI00086D59D7|nr:MULTISPECIES: GntR family transcriptional regulator [Variovorax]MBN8752832.1 GntR family transcriptional regulator [Variovorax sp.]ODU16949.1 MAG: GntR family transcriptional regulator [Variovorax sp. SCN 67-85]ODV23540.1 MAG: GntR family transcriptional regulator [Variovorax sp. SCN 67-20]OJZ15475.1 MAG: GntR family transcriptional regulator [Variovorax sp. 67-131]UKI07971.1 GntR family transcriptional regulator [Variovorax paradoxus]